MLRPAQQADHCLESCFVGQALAGLSVGLVITSPAGKLMWLNRTARDMLGIDGAPVTGMQLRQVLRDPQLTSFWHEAEGRNGTVHAEISVRWPKDFDLKVNCTECFAPDGTLVGQALLLCDVTDDRTVRLELSEAVTRRLLEMTGESPAPGEPEAGLTPQELQVVRLVGKGLGNQDIADELQVALSTVRSHLKNVYRKLGLASRAEAVSYAVRNHLA